MMPIPVAKWSKGAGLQLLACLDCRFKSRWGHGCLSLLSVVCCPVQVSATGRPTDCGVSKRDLETSTMRRLIPTKAVAP